MYTCHEITGKSGNNLLTTYMSVVYFDEVPESDGRDPDGCI